MSSELQTRAHVFLNRPIPSTLPYVPDSISERFIAAYAADGQLDLDAELAELLDLCVAEAFNEAQTREGEEAAFFQESASILQAIQSELA